jgi:radical S-adenosyl methionine domain-containing protein 2
MKSDFTQNDCGAKTNSLDIEVKSANWHFTSICNYRCIFCSTQKLLGDLRSIEVAKNVLYHLKRLGIEKINYVGGEPFCNPHIYELIKLSKEMGFTVSIVTNGARLNERSISKIAHYIDWIGLSVDSASDEVEAKLGRGHGNHVSHALKIAPLIIKHGIKLKINTTVTKLNVNEDMSILIEKFRPDRWKVFQFMHVPGQNDHCIDSLAIKRSEFEAFKKSHSGLRLKNGLKPVFESEEMMLESYLMISPAGNIFMNNRFPHIEYDISTMTIEKLKEIMDTEMYISRGALYDW